MWHQDVLGTIGDTPLVRINRLAADLPVTVLAKVEYFNPGGSVKDRIGVSMVEAAEQDGRLKPGGTIIECTSGNTGAGLALAGIVKGYKCIFTTTDKQSREKVNVLKALGAEVIVCPTNVAPEDPKSYYSVAERLSREIPNSFFPNQYDNPANTAAHVQTTGPEIWEQTEGKITHFICGAGTGGTISGCSEYLKSKNPDIQTIGVDPFGSVYAKYWKTREFDEAEIYPYITEGVGEDILAGNMNFDLVDDYVQVTDRDSMVTTRRLSRDEGLFVGGSCGMAMAGAIQWIKSNQANLKETDVVVVLLPDSGFRYLSKIYDDAWMSDHGFLRQTIEMTAADILAKRKRDSSGIVTIHPDKTVSEAIDVMSQHDISQIPVAADGDFVGSLSESSILNLLLEKPESGEQSIRDVMDQPFPVVSSSMQLESLSSYLDRDVSALLVEDPADSGFEIITKSDLISALARVAGGKRNHD